MQDDSREKRSVHPHAVPHLPAITLWAKGSPTAPWAAAPWLGPASEQGNILPQRQGGGTVVWLQDKEDLGNPVLLLEEGFFCSKTEGAQNLGFRSIGLQNRGSAESPLPNILRPEQSPRTFSHALLLTPPSPAGGSGTPWLSGSPRSEPLRALPLPQDPSSRDISDGSPQLRGSQWVGGVGVRKTAGCLRTPARSPELFLIGRVTCFQLKSKVEERYSQKVLGRRGFYFYFSLDALRASLKKDGELHLPE